MIRSLLIFILTLPFLMVKALCSCLPFWGSPLTSGLLGWAVFNGLEGMVFPYFRLDGSIAYSAAITGAVGLMALIYGFQGYFPARKKRSIIKKASDLNKLRDLSWEDFEILVSQVFKVAGYKVKALGGAQADGGIDVEAFSRRDGRIIIQCKHWSVPVGVKVVRETLGVMYKVEADRAMVVVTGEFTRDAIDFAEGQPIELMSGRDLLKFMRTYRTANIVVSIF